MAITIQTVPGGTSGDDTITTSLLKDFFVDALAGEDEITIEETASAYEIQARAGEDLITANGDATASLIKGGAENDTFNFKGAVINSSIYGGKAADSIVFVRTVTGGIISGDTGADLLTFADKISGGSVIDGGADDDTLTFAERITASTIRGGAARDSIDVNDNSSDSAIDLGADNDRLTITGKHTNLEVKGAAGDDTIDIEANLSGTGNKFYAGKGDDSIEVNSGATLAIHSDDDDDVIRFVGTPIADGASVYGGSGDDSLILLTGTGSEVLAKGNAGDDDIDGSSNAAKETLFGGQGDDTIASDSSAVAAGSNKSRFYYGDKGDDELTINGNDEASLGSGGEGDDKITMDTAANATDKKGHTIDGGAGVDTISLTGVALGAAIKKVQDNTPVLLYSSFAEFYSEGDIVDKITIGNTTAAKAEVAEKLSFATSDEFDRAVTGGAVRDTALEGLVITTSSKVSSGSSITFDKDADNYLAGIDLSAGTTGDSTIDNSKGDGYGMRLKGGDGKNTIKGGAGADYIYGGSKNDVLSGGTDSTTTAIFPNTSADGGHNVIDGGTAGKDSIVGGTLADSIQMNSGLNKQDTISGGAGADTLSFKDGDSTTSDLDGVTLIEAITLGNAATDIILADSTIADSGTLTVTPLAVGNDKAIKFSAAAETSTTVAGTINITGAKAADSLVGGAGNDTFNGAGGADTLTGGAGANDFIMSKVVETTGSLAGDIITDFVVANTDQIGNFSLSNLKLLTALTDLVELSGATTIIEEAVDTGSVDLTVAPALNTVTAGVNLLTFSGNYATTAAFQTAVRSATHTGLAAGDGFLTAFDDGTDTTVALVTTALGTTAAISDAVVTELATLNGLADATTLVEANTLPFIA